MKFRVRDVETNSKQKRNHNNKFDMRVGRTRYLSRSEIECRSQMCYFILVVLAAIFVVFVYNMEWDWKEKNIAFSEARSNILEASDEKFEAFAVGQPIHFKTTNIKPTENLKDHDFFIEAPTGTLRMKRVTEFCQ